MRQAEVGGTPGPARRRPAPVTVVTAVGAVLVWAASAAVIWHGGGHWHLDLRVYRGAGRALLHGGAPFRQRFTSSRLLFTYTPFALLVLSPVSFGPLGLVEGAWWVASGAALVATLFMVLPAPPAWGPGQRVRRLAVAALLGGAATLVLQPVRSNLDYGQINLFLLWLVVADLRRSGRRRGGWAIGLAAAIKLTPLVFLLYYAVRRDWRSVARGGGVFAGCALLSWVVLPGDSALYWWHEVGDTARVGRPGFVSNQSLEGLLRRPPFTALGDATGLVWVALCLAVVGAGVVVARRQARAGRPLGESVLTLALVELSVSPISWDHHWSWLALAPVAAWTRWRHDRWGAGALVLALCVGVAAPYWWGVRGGVAGS